MMHPHLIFVALLVALPPTWGTVDDQQVCEVRTEGNQTELVLTKDQIKKVFSHMFLTQSQLRREALKWNIPWTNEMVRLGGNYTTVQQPDDDFSSRNRRDAGCCETYRFFRIYNEVHSAGDRWYVVHFNNTTDPLYQYIQEADCRESTGCMKEYSCHFMALSLDNPATTDPLPISIKPVWFPSYCKCV